MPFLRGQLAHCVSKTNQTRAIFHRERLQLVSIVKASANAVSALPHRRNLVHAEILNIYVICQLSTETVRWFYACAWAATGDSISLLYLVLLID